MKRILFLFVATMALAACGEDKIVNAPADSPKGDWSTVTDPETGVTLRCYSYFQDNSGHQAGGPALWCYVV